MQGAPFVKENLPRNTRTDFVIVRGEGSLGRADKDLDCQVKKVGFIWWQWGAHLHILQEAGL